MGAIITSVMMERLNVTQPYDYLIAMRILWAPIVLMLPLWAFVPESPWYFARLGRREKALKAMRHLYGGVEGYDYDEEYSIILRTIEHEKSLLQEAPRYRDVLRGLNLVSMSQTVSERGRN